MSKRRIFLAFLLSPLTYLKGSNDDIQLFIGPDKDLTVNINNISKESLVEILSVFLSRDNEDVKQKLTKLLGECENLTLSISTRKQGR